MNGYAAIAFATPLAALGLGWLAVALHRRSLHRRLSPAERADREQAQWQELDEHLAALRARLDEATHESALLRARLDQQARERLIRKEGPEGRAVTAG